MGLAVALFARHSEISENLKLFLTVGFLGSFTTFSTFSMDAMTLYLRGDFGGFLSYMAASVICSIGALALGSYLVWRLSS
jgi:CrcB protein